MEPRSDEQQASSAGVATAASRVEMASVTAGAGGVVAAGRVTFRGLEDLKDYIAEQERLTSGLRQRDVAGVSWTSADTVEFTAARIEQIPELLEALEYKDDPAAPDGRTLMHELLEFGCRVEAAYRTAGIRAGLETTLSFRVTPGARLFYVPYRQPEQEIEVGADGGVSFRIQIARGQESIYGRMELGEVKRYIKVDVFTGAVSDVTEGEYREGTGGTAP